VITFKRPVQPTGRDQQAGLPWSTMRTTILTLTGSATLNTMMARVIGKKPDGHRDPRRTVKWGNDRLRRPPWRSTNTGSMNDNGKITAPEERHQEPAHHACSPPPPCPRTFTSRSSRSAKGVKRRQQQLQTPAGSDWTGLGFPPTRSTNNKLRSSASMAGCGTARTCNYAGSCPNSTTAANHNTWNGCVHGPRHRPRRPGTTAGL